MALIRDNELYQHFMHYINLHKQKCGVTGRYNVEPCPCSICSDFKQSGQSRMFMNCIGECKEWTTPQSTSKAPYYKVALDALEENKAKIRKVIVLGDIHRDLIGFIVALYEAGIIDERLQYANVDKERIDVVVSCGDIIDGHRTSENPYNEGNEREEIDLFQVIEYLNSLRGKSKMGLYVVSTCGNHESMRKEGNIKNKGEDQVDWPVGHLSNYMAQHFPLMIQIGKCVFSHTLPNDMKSFSRLVGDIGQGGAIDHLNNLFFNYMVDVESTLRMDKNAALYKMLWDRDVIENICDGIGDFRSFLKCEDCIFFIGHTNAQCYKKKHCNPDGYQKGLCNYKVHAMDTNWSKSFLTQPVKKQVISYAIVTDIHGQPKVEAAKIDKVFQHQRPRPLQFGEIGHSMSKYKKNFSFRML